MRYAVQKCSSNDHFQPPAKIQITKRGTGSYIFSDFLFFIFYFAGLRLIFCSVAITRFVIQKFPFNHYSSGMQDKDVNSTYIIFNTWGAYPFVVLSKSTEQGDKDRGKSKTNGYRSMRKIYILILLRLFCFHSSCHQS